MDDSEFLTDLMRAAYLPFEEDKPLLEKLGLESSDDAWLENARGRHYLGRATVDNSATRPASQVHVFASTYPATFWTFVIKRARSAFHYEPCDGEVVVESGPVDVAGVTVDGPAKVRHPLDCTCEGLGKIQVLDNEPWEVITLSTGSGTLTDYWPMAEGIAGHMMEVRWISGPHPDTSDDHFAGMESEAETNKKEIAWARKVAGIDPDQEDA